MLALIKRFKLSYEFYNFFKKRELEHNLPLYKKYGLKKKYWSSLSSSDFTHLERQNIVSSQSPIEASFGEVINAQLSTWDEKGYVILKGFYDQDLVKRINAEVDELIHNKKANWRYSGSRIMFANKVSELIQKLGTEKRLTDILDHLLGKEVQLFQSINFLRASQQRAHSDSIHMSTFPQGYLTAAWIALEDMTPKNGPLFYYPGSHKLPYIMNKDFSNEGSRFMLGPKSYGEYEDKVQEQIEKHYLKKETFHAKAGDVLIWHANLLHGGEPLLDQKRTRKSLVFHYYAKDAICYHEITQRPTLKQ